MTGFETCQLSRRWLIIAPHPDDEILGCGLLMRAIERAGGSVVVAWLTDGGACHGDLPAAARADLVLRRQGEALAGLQILGVHPLVTCFLGHPDGALADPNIQQSAAATLAKLCAAHGIDCFAVTDAADSHVDHRAAHVIAASLPLPGYAYPVSARYDDAAFSVAAAALTLVDAPGAARKRAGLACHASQSAAAGARYPLSAATIDRFCRAPEYFVPIDRTLP